MGYKWRRTRKTCFVMDYIYIYVCMVLIFFSCTMFFFILLDVCIIIELQHIKQTKVHYKSNGGWWKREEISFIQTDWGGEKTRKDDVFVPWDIKYSPKDCHTRAKIRREQKSLCWVDVTKMSLSSLDVSTFVRTYETYELVDMKRNWD